MSTSFDETWVPRIGKAAAAELRRNGYLTLSLTPLVFVCAIIASVGFGKGDSSGSTAGVAAVVVAFALCAVWFRSRLRLTNELSKRFNSRIRWYEVPNMKAPQFDAWCQRRNFQIRD